MMAIIYHLTNTPDWEPERQSGEYRAESLESEGFIHCSQSEDQMLQVANRLYSDQREMLVLDVDTARLVSPVKYEEARSGGVFPHIYGPLNTDAVTRSRVLRKESGGSFYLLPD